MAIVSILAGIFSGMLSFVLGLVAGHGILLALGMYLIGGFSGMILMLCIVALRARGAARDESADAGLVPAQA